MRQYTLKWLQLFDAGAYYQSISDFKVRILEVTQWTVTMSEYLHDIVSVLFTAAFRIHYMIYFSQGTGVILAKL